MALIFYKNNESSGKLKCTIQQTGRLGFTDATAKQLRLHIVDAVQFAKDDQEDDTLYLVNDVNESEPNAFKVCKAGMYYYVNTKHLFEELGLDFESNTIIFDLKREPKYKEMEVYKMTKRVLPRKKK